jgi:hypothetical protein
MLCTTWAADAGSTNIHHMTKASASHPAMLLAFKSPPTGAQTVPLPETMLTRARFPANANGVKLPCRHEYAPASPSVCPIGESSA